MDKQTELFYEAQARIWQLMKERDRLRSALEQIGGFTLSQFMGPNDMALACVTKAREALSTADSASGGT